MNTKLVPFPVAMIDAFRVNRIGSVGALTDHLEMRPQTLSCYDLFTLGPALNFDKEQLYDPSYDNKAGQAPSVVTVDENLTREQAARNRNYHSITAQERCK